MNRLGIDKQIEVLSLLVEGMGIRPTARNAKVSKNTVIKLLQRVGQASNYYIEQNLNDLPCKRFQCDEIWSFCYSKEKNVPEGLKGEYD